MIRDAGGTIYYDWMLKPIYDADGNVPFDAPKWLRESLGDEYFQQVPHPLSHF